MRPSFIGIITSSAWNLIALVLIPRSPHSWHWKTTPAKSYLRKSFYRLISFQVYYSNCAISLIRLHETTEFRDGEESQGSERTNEMTNGRVCLKNCSIKLVAYANREFNLMYKRIFIFSIYREKRPKRGREVAEQTKKMKKKSGIYVSMCKSYLIHL